MSDKHAGKHEHADRHLAEQLRKENDRLYEEGQRLRRYIQKLAGSDDSQLQLIHELDEAQEQLDLRVAERTSELQQTNEHLQSEIAERKMAQQQVIRLNQEVEDTQREVILKLAEVVEDRSKETGLHVMRVAELSHLIALRAGLNQQQAELVRLAAPMHDVGKVGVPDSILLNPGRLSAEEFETMKDHTTIGYDMLKGSKRKILQTAALIALQHHEKFNGTGYPHGLKREEISLFGRITCLTDVFDALSSDRVYRKAWDIDRVLDYFRHQRGESFDPYLVDLMFANLDEMLAIKDSFHGDVPSAGDDVPEQPQSVLMSVSSALGVNMEPRGAQHVDKSHNQPRWRNAATGLGIRDITPGSDEEYVQRVLVADSDPQTLGELESALSRWGYDVTCAADGEEAGKIIAGKDSANLVILDYDLTQKSGLDLCHRIRELQEDYVYVVLLVNPDHKKEVALSLAAGADACITKPVDLDELRARLSAGERILTLESELIFTQQSLVEQATHDALTGLWNRAAILNMLHGEIDRAKREDTSVGVMMADLDKFKRINDEFGHRAGDLVLREAAQRMRSVMRPYDMVGRYGGEEFLMIVPRCDLTFAGYVAERVRASLADTPIRVNGRDLTVTMSLGVAAKRGVEDCDSEILIQAADAAMYRAKNAGRNCIEVAELLAA